MEAVRLQVGDVFFTHGDTLLGTLIRAFERDKGEAPSNVNHVGLITCAGWYAPDAVLIPKARSTEALWKVRCAEFEESYQNYKGRFSVYRPRFIVRNDYPLIAATANEYCNRRYGWWKLLFHAFNKEGVLRWRKYPICSSLVGDVYERCLNYTFGKPGLAVDPDDIEDWILAHPQEWDCVRPLLPPR